MKYVSLEPSTEAGVRTIVYNLERSLEERYQALQSAVRHGDPRWSMPILYELMQSDQFELVGPAFALLDMAVWQHRIIDLEIDLVEEWVARYTHAHPEQADFLRQNLNEIKVRKNSL